MTLPSLRDILTAWARANHPTAAQQALAEQRLAACQSCRHQVEVPGAEIFANLRLCGLCGCPLPKKIYSPGGPESCPAGRWTA